MILRAKTKDLFDSSALTSEQLHNSKINSKELAIQKSLLDSYPRRLIFELTNACNLNCIMCGRNEAEFCKTFFDIEWLSRFDCILNEVEEVTLMGWGEPTVHPRFRDILIYLNKFPVRKYFCTNGMLLDRYIEDIFDHKVDIIAISLDGASKGTNDKIRKGSDFDKITNTLKTIVEEKRKRDLTYPYMNFVMTMMRSNIHELPDLVKLAHAIGLDEVKVVYFTAFSEQLRHESLYHNSELVQKVFTEAEQIANKLNVLLKLPYLENEDPAGAMYHRPCYVAWRDFFVGSDGYIRPCMSTPIKFFELSRSYSFEEMWNSKEFQEFRKKINQEDKMPESCKLCYQSSYANWNRKESFIQIGECFAPDWES